MRSCTNCGAELKGSFCHECGQKADIKRLTFRSVFTEFSERLLGFDSKVGRTLKYLTIQPGLVPKKYIEGNRVLFMGPVAYYFALITLYVLLVSAFDLDLMQQSKEATELFSTGETSPKQQEFGNNLQQIFASYFRLFIFLFIPFFVIGQALMFRKKGLNFIEHATITFYGQAHPMIVTILGLSLYVLDVQLSVSVTMVIGIIYYAVLCASFFSGNVLWNFIKGIVAYLLGLLFIFIFSILMFFVVAIIDPSIVP